MHLATELHDAAQLHCLLALVEFLALLLVNRARLVRDLGIAEDETFLELVYHRLIQTYRMYEVAAAFELDHVESAERGGVLVLPAAGDAKVQPSGLDRHFGDIVGRPAIEPQLVEGRDHRRRYRGRAAEAGAHGKIRTHMQVESVLRPDNRYG